MGFLNPTFLVALAGAGIPVLIHLLTRDRILKVEFSTLRFFLRSSRTILRQRRVREMILLAMRMAACALLAFAFARPILGKLPEAGDGTLSADTVRVVVLDLSGSMRRSRSVGDRSGMAEAAAERALAALGDLSALTDAAGLVTFSDSVRVDFPPTRKIGDVRAAIRALRPGHGGTNIPEALRRANELLRSVNARRKEIVLVSDLQRTGWRGFRGEWRLAPGTKLVIENVSGPEDAAKSGPRRRPHHAGNVAIVDADYPRSMVKDNSPRTIAVRVANFSDVELRGVEVALTVGGREVGAREINLKAGGAVPVRFRHVFERAGDNPGTVVVRHEDASPEDNVFYFNARVIPRIKVLILNGRPSRRPLEDAAFFVKAALAPTEDSPFRAEAVEATRVAPADLADASVAILADVRTVPSAVRKALGDLLMRGGGLLFLPGGSVEPALFNRVFRGYAPCRLRGLLTPKAYVSGGEVGSTTTSGRRGEVGSTTTSGRRGEVGSTTLPPPRGERSTFKGAALTKIDFDHPVFRIFQLPHHGDLSVARFFRYWEVTDSQLARVHARFDDGRPAVLEREIGGGVSMMMVFPAELAWNDLPRRAVFLPLVHQTARYLAIRTEQKTGYRVGEALPVEVPGGGVGEIRGPGGEALPVAVPEGKEGGQVVAETPGIYTVVSPGGKPPVPVAVFRFAVNTDFAEADPRAARADEIASAVESTGGEADEVLAGAGDTERPEADVFNIWWHVMAAVAALTMGELFFGNQTQRH